MSDYRPNIFNYLVDNFKQEKIGIVKAASLLLTNLCIFSQHTTIGIIYFPEKPSTA